MKINKKFFVLAAVILALVVIFWSVTHQKKMPVKSVSRPDYGEGETTYYLECVMDGKKQDIELVVEPKEIPMEELQGYFDAAYEIVMEKIVGENESLSHVTKNLNLVSEIERYGMTVEYDMENYDYVDSSGFLLDGPGCEEGVEIAINVIISYKDFSQEYEIPMVIYERKKSAREQLEKKLMEQVEEDGEDVFLPDSIDGREVSFFAKQDSVWPLVIVFMLAVILVVVYQKYTVPRKMQEQKERQMELDYSEIVSKLSLLMGAGMSGARAFKKIASDYKRDKKEGRLSRRFAYEEIVMASNRIETGASEADVYLQFGRACHLHSYIRLGTLMSQNVKKGGTGFVELLKAEVTQSFMERKATARRAGEEAGTKLLMPMIMMLGIVLVMIMVPAFMSF